MKAPDADGRGGGLHSRVSRSESTLSWLVTARSLSRSLPGFAMDPKRWRRSGTTTSPNAPQSALAVGNRGSNASVAEETGGFPDRYIALMRRGWQSPTCRTLTHTLRRKVQAPSWVPSASQAGSPSAHRTVLVPYVASTPSNAGPAVRPRVTAAQDERQGGRDRTQRDAAAEGRPRALHAPRCHA